MVTYRLPLSQFLHVSSSFVELNEKSPNVDEIDTKVKIEETVEEDKLKMPSLPKVEEKRVSATAIITVDHR